MISVLPEGEEFLVVLDGFGSATLLFVGIARILSASCWFCYLVISLSFRPAKLKLKCGIDMRGLGQEYVYSCFRPHQSLDYLPHYDYYQLWQKEQNLKCH